MENKMQLLKPRNFGTTINDMFAFVRQNFASLGRTALTIALPFALFGGLFYSQRIAASFGHSRFQSYASNGVREGFSQPVWGAIIYYICSITAHFCMQLIIIQLFLKYESADAELPQASELIKGVRDSIFRFIGFNFVLIMPFFVVSVLLVMFFSALHTGGGIVEVFLILGLISALVYAVVAYSLAPFVYMREQHGIVNAFSRSFYLVKGFWWQTFNIIFFTYLIIAVSGIIFLLPFYSIYYILIFYSTSSGTQPVFEPSVWSMLAGSFVLCGFTILTSMLHTSIIMQYYNLVERKDGENILREIEHIGNAENHLI